MSLSPNEALPSYTTATSEKVALYATPVSEHPKVFGMKQRTLLYVLLGSGICYSMFMLSWNVYNLVDTMNLSQYFPFLQTESFYDEFQLALTSVTLMVLFLQVLCTHLLKPAAFQLGLLALFAIVASDGVAQTYFCMQGFTCPSFVLLLSKATYVAALWKSSSVIRYYKQRQLGYSEVHKV